MPDETDCPGAVVLNAWAAFQASLAQHVMDGIDYDDPFGEDQRA